MNETNYPNGTLEVPTLTSVHPLRTPGVPMPADSDKVAAAASELVKQTVQGAHDGIDSLADSAKPAIENMGERAAVAEAALRATTDQLRETGDEWVESVRTTVRENPLAAVAAALALGLLVARITR
jgi:ElaB/YqjD/DUF883 family membrane-anchored ribosome-binding protein